MENTIIVLPGVFFKRKKSFKKKKDFFSGLINRGGAGDSSRRQGVFQLSLCL